MTEDRCGRCIYYDPVLNPDSGQDIGVCHRYPKAPVMTGTEKINKSVAERATFVHFWPEMRSDDWCGEFLGEP